MDSHLLIVDDNRINLKLAGDVLEAAGYRCQRVADAERSVLSADQMNTVTQYQQWQSELRQQFGGGPGGGGRVRGNVMFAPGPQGSVAFSTVTDSASSRPTEKPANAK